MTLELNESLGQTSFYLKALINYLIGISLTYDLLVIFRISV